jgi:Fe-S cluster assembly iron-binding protein IscA
MLQITDGAEQALRQIRTDTGVAEDAAVRIGAIETLDGMVGIGFAFTDGPDDGDVPLSEADGFRVYLAKELVAALTDAAIDATSNENGVPLELRAQQELTGSAKAKLAAVDESPASA